MSGSAREVLDAAGVPVAADSLYRALFVAAVDSIIICDEHGRAIECNAAATQLLACAREQLIGTTPVDWSPEFQPDGRRSDELASEVFAKVLAGESARFEWVNIRHDGSRIDVGVTVRRMEGLPPHIVVISRDISAEKALERELRLSEEKFSKAFRISPDPIIFSEIATGLIREINPAFTSSFGFSQADVLGRTTVEIGLWADLRQREQTVARMREQGHLNNHEVDFRTKQGEVRTVLGSSVRIDIEGSPYWLVQFRDITERKAMERKLQELNAALDLRVAERTAELERAVRELEAFSYSVSHDLRAPLRAINGYARIVAECEKDKISEESCGMLDRIAHNASHMGDLIDDILEYSRLGRLPAEAQSVDLNALVAGLRPELEALYKAAKIDVGILPTVHGDRTMLRGVFQNLIENACKFSVAQASPRVEVGVTEQDGRRIFHVRDNGVGFDMRYASKLFGMFQRLHGAGEFAGTGVGLAIVKRLVERHGGRIWAEAEPGKGAVFRFTLAD